MRVIDSVMADSYNRNAGLALDADLTLILRLAAHRLASVLEHGVHKLVLKLKYEASQACNCVKIRSYTSSHFNVKI